MSPAEWPDNDPVRDSGPVNRLEASAASGWPTRIGGYVKVLLTALATVGVGGVLEWLRAAGVTDLPPAANAAITAVLAIVLVLFGPKNKP